MHFAFTGDLNYNNATTITALIVDSKYFAIQVESIFVTGSNEKQQLAIDIHVCEGQGGIMTVCILKECSGWTGNICSKLDSAKGTGLLSILVSEIYQLRVAESTILSF